MLRRVAFHPVHHGHVGGHQDVGPAASGVGSLPPAGHHAHAAAFRVLDGAAQLEPFHRLSLFHWFDKLPKGNKVLKLSLSDWLDKQARILNSGSPWRSLVSLFFLLSLY